MNITIHDPTQHALEHIAANLCKEDRDELEASGKSDALAAMLRGWQSGRECYVASWDGEVRAVFGVADWDRDDSYGIPWLLSTGIRGRVAREFLKASRGYVDAWAPMYRAMFNLVDARHLRAQRWLQHLGFDALKVHHFGSHPFIEYARIHV